MVDRTRQNVRQHYSSLILRHDDLDGGTITKLERRLSDWEKNHPDVDSRNVTIHQCDYSSNYFAHWYVSRPETDEEYAERIEREESFESIPKPYTWKDGKRMSPKDRRELQILRELAAKYRDIIKVDVAE